MEALRGDGFEESRLRRSARLRPERRPTQGRMWTDDVRFVPTSASLDSAPSRQPAAPKVRLFGQFLVGEGLITPADLDEALSLMAATNTTLGELAVSRGLMTRAEADEVHRLQQHVDGRWGELALGLGLGGLTEERLDELCWEQQASNLRLTDALVELGVMSASEIEAQLRRFEDEQDAIDPFAALPARYRDCAPVPVILAVLPRFAGRLLRTPLRMSPPRRFTARRALAHSATVMMYGDSPLEVGLSVDDELGAAFVSHMRMGTDTEDPRAFVGRFLTRLCELTTRRLTVDAKPVRIDIPDLGLLPRRGLCFDLALGNGTAMLVLART
jgi:hypothetical protein